MSVAQIDFRRSQREPAWNAVLAQPVIHNLKILVEDRLPDLRPLHRAPHITSLCLRGSGRPLGSFDFQGLEHLRQLSLQRIVLAEWQTPKSLLHLHELAFEECNLRDLAFISDMLELKKLRIQEVPQADHETWEFNIDGLMNVANLEELRFIQTRALNIPSIMAIQYLPGIKILALDGMNMQDAGVALLVRELGFLETLSLERNSLTKLPDLQEARHLLELSLRHNQIQVADFMSLPPRPVPLRVHLENNPLEKIGAPAFIQVTS